MSSFDILNHRSIISLSGKDIYSFLQGIITNDINKVNSAPIYCCLLTPQGKYYADFFITKRSEHLIIDLPTSKVESVLKKFSMYKLRADVEIKNLSNEYKVIVSNDSAIGFADPRNIKLGYRNYIANTEISKIEDVHIKDYKYEQIRIELGIAEGEKDLISEKSFPLEFGLEKLDAFNFEKGCYIGQELISRTKYRGVIRKSIHKITSDNKIPELGTDIYIGKRKIGHICSSYNNQGLALIRLEDFKELQHTEEPITADNVIINIFTLA